MDTLNNRIEDLLLHYKSEDIVEVVKSAQKRKAEREKAEAERRKRADETRGILVTAIMNYINALGLTKDLTSKEIVELRKAIIKILIEFEDDSKNVRMLTKAEAKELENYIKDFFGVGLF